MSDNYFRLLAHLIDLYMNSEYKKNSLLFPLLQNYSSILFHAQDKSNNISNKYVNDCCFMASISSICVICSLRASHYLLISWHNNISHYQKPIHGITYHFMHIFRCVYFHPETQIDRGIV